jgi:hypothetical protein
MILIDLVLVLRLVRRPQFKTIASSLKATLKVAFFSAKNNSQIIAITLNRRKIAAIFVMP